MSGLGAKAGMATPVVGQIFAGDYRVVRTLNAGGMGAVYVVDQLSTGKQRALKLMHPQLVANAEMRKRFEQEARIGARIESAHVVEVQAAGVDADSGVPWLVMELLDGEDLDTLVSRQGGLDPSEVREIFEQLCHAVAAAHRARIIHRDLKPENVFIGRGRHASGRIEVKVLDFGIAKIAVELGTDSTGAMGSPAWMPPEQTERSTLEPTADVWALGLVAYFALTGRIFWRGVSDTWTQLMRELLIDPIPSASQRAAEQGCAGRLPPGFDAWFARCVDRTPSARFPDAGAMWEALAVVLGSAPPPRASVNANAITAAAPVTHPPAAAPTLPPTLPAVPRTDVMPPIVPNPSRTTAPVGVAHIARPAAVVQKKSPIALVIAIAALVAFVGIVAVFGIVLGGGYLAYRQHQTSPKGSAVVASDAQPFDEVADASPPPVASEPAPTVSVSAQIVPPPVPKPAVPPPRGAAPGPARVPPREPAPPPPPTSTPPPASVPFDHAAASAAVGSVNVQACKEPNGPTGKGHAKIIFAMDGSVASVVLDSGPFDGTTVGSCIVARYRRLHVPPFTGGTVTFGKAIAIEP